jgi:phosphatidylserine/phosphatidylglycerophosphate/cardiolipin synthase-like enzyme
MVVPGEPMSAIVRASLEVAALPPSRRAEHRYGTTFERLAALARHPGFTLLALARDDREIYTHAKLCIVDGEWATLGSANLVDLSLTRDHTELNTTFWGRETCMPLLRRLIAEHTDAAAPDDDLDALDEIARIARASRDSRDRGGPGLAGCHALDPTQYGHAPTRTRGA